MSVISLKFFGCVSTSLSSKNIYEKIRLRFFFEKMVPIPKVDQKKKWMNNANGYLSKSIENPRYHLIRKQK